MSKISGKQFGEPFKMRVVSGMLVDGSIQVTWATGEKSSSQMDWGLTPDHLHTTPEYNGEPQDMVRYHRLWFPITYLDARHYFRVRSRNMAGKVGQSELYYVITPDGVQTYTNSLQAVITLDVIDAQTGNVSGNLQGNTDPIHKHEPLSATQLQTAELTHESFTGTDDKANSANAKTASILNIS